MITNSLYVQLYLNVILPESQKLARPLDRKTAVLSFTKTLANSEAFANKYKKGWGFTCEALLKLLELPPLPASKDDVIAEHDVEDMAFGVGFTALVTIRQQVRDPWPDTGADLKLWVGKYHVLYTLGCRFPPMLCKEWWGIYTPRELALGVFDPKTIRYSPEWLHKRLRPPPQRYHQPHQQKSEGLGFFREMRR